MNYLERVIFLFTGLPFRVFGPLPGYGLWKRVHERRVGKWWKEYVLGSRRQFHQRNFLATMSRSPFLATLQRDGGYEVGPMK